MGYCDKLDHKAKVIVKFLIYPRQTPGTQDKTNFERSRYVVLHLCLGNYFPFGLISAGLLRGLPCSSSFVQGFGPLAFDFSALDLGLFAGDDWKVTEWS